MPHAFELPRMLCAVIKLMSGERLPAFRARVVHELVALGLWRSLGRCPLAWWCSRLCPSLASIIRALNDLPEPAARLRRVQPVRVRRRSFDVVNLPARKVRTAHVPLLALSIRGQHERTLPRPNQ